MAIKEILQQTEHRPWELPTKGWRFYQEWNNAIFLHWQVDPAELKKFLPQELEIDLFDGKPWVSLVAFTMEKIRPRFLPAIPLISNFDEVNIRTYIKSNNKTGVYFLSIEGGKKLSCVIAKGISGLPYRFSNISRTSNQYRSANHKFDDQLDLAFDIGPKLSVKTELDKWLTERYALFQDEGRRVYEFEIHHLEWPVHTLTLRKFHLRYRRFESLIQDLPDVSHYSSGVKVMAWGRQLKS